jgi:hypothetical protein
MIGLLGLGTLRCMSSDAANFSMVNRGTRSYAKVSGSRDRPSASDPAERESSSMSL